MPSKIVRQSNGKGLQQVALGPWTQGVNERTEPHLLDFSELQDASNCIFDEIVGRVKQRPGSVFRKQVPNLIDAPRRAYNFTKRDGTQILLLTDGKKLVATEDLDIYVDITPTVFLNGGEFAGGATFLDFATVVDRVWITNGVDPVMSWDGIPANPVIVYDKTAGSFVTASSSTATNIALDRAGDGTTWVGQKVVVTSGGAVGLVSTITSFDDGADSIVFDAIPGLSGGDTIRVGLEIPRGKNIAFHHDTVFLASTVVNPKEVRFNDDVNPDNATINMQPDNPNAWPATLQFEVGSGGDRLWGFTKPVYRNRIGIFSANGIYRIEPDPTFRFVPVTITEQFGSRFPNTWQQHGNVLMFLGQDHDGLPDVFMTDFVSVKHFDRKHHKTLDSLQQPNAIIKSFIANSQEFFSAGLGSTLTDFSSATIKVGTIDTTSEWNKQNGGVSNLSIGGLVANSIAQGNIPNGVNGWQEKFEGNTSPGNTGWANVATVNASDSSDGVRWRMFQLANGFSERGVKKVGVFNPGEDALIRCRGRALGGDNATLGFGIWTGAFHVSVEVVFRTLQVDPVRVNGGLVASFADNNAFHEYELLLRQTGTWRLKRDGAVIGTGSATATAFNKIQMGFGTRVADPATVERWQISNSGSGAGEVADVDFMYFHTGGTKIGYIDVVLDYKRDLSVNPSIHRYGKFHLDSTLNGGSVALQTSSSIDNISFTAPEALGIGDEPGVDNATPIRQYLKVRVTLTAVDIDKPMSVQALTGGIIYWSPNIRIGSDIKSWQIFQLNKAIATGQYTIKTRRATQASLGLLLEPDPNSETGWLIDGAGAIGNKTDAEGWRVDNGNVIPGLTDTLTDVDNIGTVYGGDDDAPNPPDPITLFVQFKIEASKGAFAETNETVSVLYNWLEGSAFILPTQAIMFKKKFLLSGATVDSEINNKIVTLDSSRSFSNWDNLNTPFFVWFKGKLYIGNSVNSDILELTSDAFSDDDGADAPAGRKQKAIVSFVETGFRIGGAIHIRKKARYLETVASPGDCSIDFSARREIDATSSTQLGTVVFSTTKSYKRLNFPIGFSYRRVAIKAENNTLNQDMCLEGMILGYLHQPGRSSD